MAFFLDSLPLESEWRTYPLRERESDNERENDKEREGKEEVSTEESICYAMGHWLCLCGFCRQREKRKSRRFFTLM